MLKTCSMTRLPARISATTIATNVITGINALRRTWPYKTRLNGVHGYQMFTRAEIISLQSSALISALFPRLHGIRDITLIPAMTLQTSAMHHMMKYTVKHWQLLIMMRSISCMVNFSRFLQIRQHLYLSKIRLTLLQSATSIQVTRAIRFPQLTFHLSNRFSNLNYQKKLNRAHRSGSYKRNLSRRS